MPGRVTDWLVAIVLSFGACDANRRRDEPVYARSAPEAARAPCRVSERPSHVPDAPQGITLPVRRLEVRGDRAAAQRGQRVGRAQPGEDGAVDAGAAVDRVAAAVAPQGVVGGVAD